MLVDVMRPPRTTLLSSVLSLVCVQVCLSGYLVQQLSNGTCYQSTEDALADYCYVMSDEAATWSAAAATCSDVGGHLAVVPNTATNDFLSELMQVRDVTEAWIGATEVKTNLTWFGQEDQGLGPYSNWNPSNWRWTGCAATVHYNNYTWVVKSCAFPMGYICQYDIQDNMTCKETLGRDDAVRVADRCLVVHTDATSWFNALSACQVTGGILVVIDSQDVQLTLMEEVPLPPANLFLNGYWIGLSTDSWSWVTGEPFSFPLLWEVSRPAGVGKCATLAKFASKYQWADLPCEQPNSFICQINLRTTKAPETTPTAEVVTVLPTQNSDVSVLWSTVSATR